MPPDHSPPLDKADLLAELAAIEAESIGWVPLEDGAYLHLENSEAMAGALAGDMDALTNALAHSLAKNDAIMVIEVVGVPDIAMADLNVLLLT